ncbi:sugar transferase [Thioclava sp.]|uniref:sugar transferase n=1 Tax=Thioclava sp. TaxID=1933450 RepID=UPI003AA8E133
MDICVAAIAIILFSPLLLCVAIMVWLTSPGPVFYGHERVGYGGRVFRCWKFRSMVVDADLALAHHLAQSAAARREWEETCKLRNDPRITAIGQVLRAASIDELPQLFNVLVGDMSLVGPRPVAKKELARYGRSSRHYLSVRPGITGLWQVSGRSKTNYFRRVALDRAYVQNCGIGLDLKILMRTVPTVLKADGSW